MNALSLVMYRREDLSLVDGDHCAAILLQAIRFWSSSGAVWVDKTQAEIVAEIDGMFGLSRVAAALKRLVVAGLIERRKHPTLPQVQTYQYRVAMVDAPETDLHRENLSAPVSNSQSLNLTIGSAETTDSSLYESESELDWESESSPRVREGDEPTQDGDDDDCPAPVREEIKRIRAQIGASRVRDVLARCEGKARSWYYIIKALRNERDQKRPSPSSALPPPQYAYVPPVDEAWERHLTAGGAA